MRIAIITPVFNDWPSVSQLINAIDLVEVSDEIELCLFAIDDGSNEPAVINYSLQKLHHIREIEIIHLTCNLGHQRAIAVGLVEICGRKVYDACLIMDSDGEDRPSDIPRLLAEAERKPDFIICAQRRSRPGLIVFRLWYECYKVVFRLLTGSRIDFGNFCFIPKSRIEALVSNPGIWNNLAGALTRSRIPLASLPSDRGSRFAGKSKMNFVSLVMHGLSAMAVYSDIVMVRLLLSTLALSAITFFAILGVIGIRLFTNLAIPGWATTAAGLLTIILMQAIMLSTISVFNMLSTRSVNVIIPKLDASNFILSRRKIFPLATIDIFK